MRIPTSIVVLCTLVARTTAQCMECTSSFTFNSVTYTLQEQCTVRSGYHCLWVVLNVCALRRNWHMVIRYSYRGNDPVGDFCDCYYNVRTVLISGLLIERNADYGRHRDKRINVLLPRQLQKFQCWMFWLSQLELCILGTRSLFTTHSTNVRPWALCLAAPLYYSPATVCCRKHAGLLDFP